MANILYAVAGEGMGHATRSDPVIKHLEKKHTMTVVSADRAYGFLSKKYKTEKIDYFRIMYRNDRLATVQTTLYNILKFPLLLKRSLKIKKIIDEQKIDLIISDFEPFSTYFGLLKKVPVLSIDNQQIITEADHSGIVKDWKFHYFLTKIVVNLFTPKVKRKIIYSLVQGKSRNQSVQLIKPILRETILKLKPTNKGHVLVYQTAPTNKNLEPTLLNSKNEKFVVYGFDKNKKVKNIRYKKTNEKEFFKDLSSAKAVITNGGFGLIAEAIYLKKPILSIPVKKHFEQILNAIQVHMSGFGEMQHEFSEFAVDKFIYNLKEYEEFLSKTKTYTNKEAFDVIDKTVEKLVKRT